MTTSTGTPATGTPATTPSPGTPVRTKTRAGSVRATPDRDLSERHPQLLRALLVTASILGTDAIATGHAFEDQGWFRRLFGDAAFGTIVGLAVCLLWMGMATVVISALCDRRADRLSYVGDLAESLRMRVEALLYLTLTTYLYAGEWSPTDTALTVAVTLLVALGAHRDLHEQGQRLLRRRVLPAVLVGVLTLGPRRP